MARKKKYVKGMPHVSICRKIQSGGRIALYLKWRENGKQVVEYCHDEYGHILHLVDDSTLYADEINTTAFNMAKALQAVKLQEITSGKEQRIKARSKMLLQDWINITIDDKVKRGYRGANVIYNAQRALYMFDANAKLSDVNKDFVLRFQSYLKYEKPHRNDMNTKNKEVRHLSNTTIVGYIQALGICLKFAVKKGYLKTNAVSELDSEDRIKAKSTQREFLTADELHKLINTKCGNDEVKRAFLFSCYCGLRYSDVIKLQRKNIILVNGKYKANITITKTQRFESLPLNAKAMEYININGDAEELLFNLPSKNTINVDIKRWVKRAEIDKKVSFHTARHTFATLCLSKMPLQMVSSLMGHKHTNTTEIYAKIIDEDRIQAVNMLNDL